MNIRMWACVPAFMISSAFAENIEEIVVSASPIHKSHSDNASPISVLNGDALRTRAAATLADTLAGEVGISTTAFGTGVGNPVIRGQSGARIKVMQDNLDTLDASTTSADHANTTEPLLADQIEILRGPATLRFGSGAIGGVINVIDSRIPRQLSSDSFSGVLETRHSTVNDENASVLRLDGSVNNVAWHADGVYRESNNTDIPGFANAEDPDDSSHDYIENSNARANAYNLGASWFGERGMIGLSINQQENQYGIPPGAHEHHHDGDAGGKHDEEEVVRIDMEQTRYDLKAELDQPLAGFEKIRVRMAYNDYQHRELEGSKVGTTFKNEAYESRIEMLHNPIQGWHGAIGLQILDREFSAVGDEAFIPHSKINSVGVFLIEEKHWDTEHPQWLEWGLRIEQQSIDPKQQRGVDHTTTSASIAYHWSPFEQHHYSVSMSLAERAPTLEELLSNGPHVATQSYDIGNRNLKEERSRNLDVGYQWHPEDATSLLNQARINVFYNQIDDYIYAFNTGVEHPTEELNIFRYIQEDANFYGIEAETVLRLSDRFKLRLFGDYVRAKLDRGGDIPRNTPARAGTELSYEHGAINASIKWLKVAKQNKPGLNEETTDGYEQLDAQAQWQINSGATPVTLFVRGNNLLNHEIRHATSLLREVAPAAGRNITTGIRVNF